MQYLEPYSWLCDSSCMSFAMQIDLIWYNIYVYSNFPDFGLQLFFFVTYNCWFEIYKDKVMNIKKQ